MNLRVCVIFLGIVQKCPAYTSPSLEPLLPCFFAVCRCMKHTQALLLLCVRALSFLTEQTSQVLLSFQKL